MKTLHTYTRQAGITLVELMIAITIGLVLTGGLIEVYLGSKQSYNLAEASSRIQENGRFSIDLLARDIRMADFWGCLKQPEDADIADDVDWPAGEPGFDAAVGIEGTNDDGANGSDSITMRGAFGAGIVVEPPFMNTNSSALHVSADNGLAQADILLVSNCTNGDVFQVSNANPNTTGTVAHNTGAVTAPGNATGDLSTTYREDAQIYAIRSTTYDIQNSATTGRTGLFRNGVEIIENVESMQILYGEDTDGDARRTPNRYVPADAVGNMDNVVSLRVSLLISNEDEFLPTATAQSFRVSDVTVNTNDRRLRRVYNTTVTIRNRVP